MTQLTHPNRIRVYQPLLLFGLIAVAIGYSVIAFNSGNWLWFQSSVPSARPARVVINNHGQRQQIGPEHPAFPALADAAEAALADLGNTALIDIGLSAQTLDAYETDSLTLELYFDRPLHFNTVARTGNPTQLLLPIEGRHSGHGHFFRGDAGTYWYGAMRLSNPQPLIDAVHATINK